jgi:hypothetical protein
MVYECMNKCMSSTMVRLQMPLTQCFTDSEVTCFDVLGTCFEQKLISEGAFELSIK